MNVKICNLKNHPEYIEEVSLILFKEWQEPYGGLSLEETTKRTKNIFKENKGIPTILIALDGNVLVGTCSLWISDINERQDLFPFIASLFIKKDFRKKGIAKKLVFEIEKIAINNNWDKIYLDNASGIEGLYNHFGYSFLEKDEYHGKTYEIYYKKFIK